ncbi:dihydrofolate reductase family protein [Spartinivicinus ruber]|uniref:dihydrofolate reductase family protein n=1 Tax=Spartinivicinus ruber TaxID=2683272 RepID=UPI0013D8B24E|nr:dihydrofolate reductase family protein [Spartinivicinus ruber]
MQVSAYIATSLDGFIAKKNGDIDWLMDAECQEEDYGYENFIKTVSCLVIGRNTFEKILSFSEWPYPNKRVVVLSNIIKQLPDLTKHKSELFSGELTSLIEKLSMEGEQRLYVDGGITIQSFLQLKLLTDITITKIPVLLGEGIPLFGSVISEVKLTHVETKIFNNGFVQTQYIFNDSKIALIK